MLLAITPDNQILIVGVVVTLIAARLTWTARSGFGRIFFAAVTLCFLVPSAILMAGKNPWFLDARHRTYREFYWSIRRAMTRQEVISLMHSLYPLGEPRLRPTIGEDSASKLIFYMNPEGKPGPYREGISLRMDFGRVVGTDYISDPGTK